MMIGSHITVLVRWRLKRYEQYTERRRVMEIPPGYYGEIRMVALSWVRVSSSFVNGAFSKSLIALAACCDSVNFCSLTVTETAGASCGLETLLQGWRKI